MIRFAITVIYIFLSACVHRQEPPLDVQAQSEQCVTKNVPCPKLLMNSIEVRKKYGCDKWKDLPFLVIESQKPTPTSPQRGKEFEHYFVYSACVSEDITSIKVTLSRKIFFKKSLVFESKNDNFEIKPGKWGITAKIKTPPAITPGKYLFQTIITIPNKITITDKKRFTIKK